MIRRSVLALAAALGLGGAAVAHHGWGSYDASKPVVFEGPVQSLTWAFPHGHIKLAHDGAVWDLVLAPPSRMQARGLSEAMLAVGRPVRAEGYASTAVQREARIERISVDGKTFELR